MQEAQTYLEIVRNRGERRLPLERVYHNLKNRELFLAAYAKLYRNAGATTAGIDPSDTVDAMSLKRINQVIEQLKTGDYRWKPARRIHLPKKNGKTRALAIPSQRKGKQQPVRYRRRTPAMAVGLTYKHWTVKELLSYPLP